MTQFEIVDNMLPERKENKTITMHNKAVFLLDIEVELAWGTIDKQVNLEKLRVVCNEARFKLNNILQLLTKYNVPVTWAIVGHLLLNHCDRVSGIAHPDMPRPSYKWLKGDWYKLDPCKNLAEEPAFYGQDLFDKITSHVSAGTVHDIVPHSFSHQLLGDSGCSRIVAEAEMEKCAQLFSPRGLHPKVFVFPRDSVGHLDVLKNHGIVAFRGPIPHVYYWFTEKGIFKVIKKYFSLAVYMASFFFLRPAAVVTIQKESGLLNIPASLCYNKKRLIPLSLIVLKAKKGIDRAIKEKKIFHLYTHLDNFAAAPNKKAFLQGFEEILSYVAMKREKGEIEITTFRRLAEGVGKVEDGNL